MAIIGYLPLHDADCMLQDVGKFFEQVRSVASLLKLLYYANNDFVVDAFCVDFRSAGLWWRSCLHARRHADGIP